MHDKDKSNTKTKPNNEESHNLVPEMARLEYEYGRLHMGVTTLHHYERISSRDLGLEKLRIFRTEVVLAFPGGFTVGMM